MNFVFQKLCLLSLAAILWSGVVIGMGDERPIKQPERAVQQYTIAGEADLPKLPPQFQEGDTIYFQKFRGLNGIYRCNQLFDRDKEMRGVLSSNEHIERRFHGHPIFYHHWCSKFVATGYFAAPKELILHHYQGNWDAMPQEPSAWKKDFCQSAAEGGYFFAFSPNDKLLASKEGTNAMLQFSDSGKEESAFKQTGTYKSFKICPGKDSMHYWSRVCAVALVGVALVTAGVKYFLNNRG